MATFEEVWEALQQLPPERRAMFKRGSDIEPPVYETEEEMWAARLR